MLQIKVLSKYIEKLTLFNLIKNFPIFFWFGILSNKKFAIFLKNFISIRNRFGIAWIDSFIYGLIKIFKFYLELKGTSYKFKIINQLYFFGILIRLGFSHMILIKIPKNFRVFFYNKHILCFYHNNLCKLNNTLKLITFQHKINIYKGKGIFWKNSILKLKKSTKLKF